MKKGLGKYIKIPGIVRVHENLNCPPRNSSNIEEGSIYKVGPPTLKRSRTMDYNPALEEETERTNNLEEDNCDNYISNSNMITIIIIAILMLALVLLEKSRLIKWFAGCIKRHQRSPHLTLLDVV